MMSPSTLAYLVIAVMSVSFSEAATHQPPLGARYHFGSRWGLGQLSATTGTNPLLGSHSSSVGVPCWTCVPRGGSEAPADEEAEDEDEEENDDEEEEEETEGKKDITSMEPLVVQVKTNLGSKVVDMSFELNAVRTRDVESIKKNLARRLPGKPPMEMIRLLQHGQVLRDEVLVDELMEEEDEDDDTSDDDDDEEKKPSLTLVLDMVPPVDPRYASELEEKLPETSTADLLEAYTLTEAALWLSSQFVAQEKQQPTEGEEASSSVPSPLISFQLRQYATALQAQLEEHLYTDTATSLLEDTTPPAEAEAELAKQPQIKGQRVRPSAAGGGVKTSSSVVGLKQTAQHYLNIHWGDTFRNFWLFLFFGWFGGRTVTSRAVLLLGAPLCFIVQARPVKLWYKTLLYTVLRNPPSILLSLMPAPQQAMLSLSDETALKMIYGEEDAPLPLPTPVKALDDTDVDEEYDLDVMEEVDSEDEDDDDDDDDSDEYDEEDEDE